MDTGLTIDVEAVPGLLQWWGEFAAHHDNTKLVFGSMEPLGDPSGAGVVVSIAALGTSANQSADIQNLLLHSHYVPIGLLGTPNKEHGADPGGTIPEYCAQLLPPLEDNPHIPADRRALLDYVMQTAAENMKAGAKPLTPEDIRKMDA